MLEYLKDYVSEEDFDIIKTKLDKNMILNFSVMQTTVSDVLTSLKNKGITNIKNIILSRPDLCFKTINYLEEEFNKLDSELLKYIINNHLDELNSFNI